MSNDYYNYSDTLLPGQVAQAEDVSGEFEAVQAGLDLLPKPREDGQGFAEPFIIAEATNETHAATWGQLQNLESSASTAASNAATSESNAATSESNAATSETNAAASESAASTSETNAATSEAKAQEWATKNEDVEVETGEYSAKHWAKKAAAIASSARSFQGYYDASSGDDPIASPASGDEGKFWIIEVAGTLSAGTVEIGDEYAITDSLTYQIVDLSSVYVQKSNNGTDFDDGTATLTNLGAGSAAFLDTGTGANQVAQRDSNGDVPGDITGAAASATTASGADKLNTARSIALGGDLSGSANFDGTANITITAAVSDDSHNHTISNVDGLQSSLNSKLNNSSNPVVPVDNVRFTNQESSNLSQDGDVIWDLSDGLYNRRSGNAYKMWDSGNDGSGSGLNADKLDDVEGSGYLKKSEMDTTSVGSLLFAGQTDDSVFEPGDTIAGSQLRASNARGLLKAGSYNGTWRCLGYSSNAYTESEATLWIRIS